MIEVGAARGGRRTGLFTSPHLAEPTERIRIDGVPISAAEFAAAFDRVHAAVEELLAAGRIDLHTTYFETVTAMALLIFARSGVDVWCWRSGSAAGSMPPTSCSPSCASSRPWISITRRSSGKSLEAIAGEKAGILKAGRAGGVRAAAAGSRGGARRARRGTCASR